MKFTKSLILLAVFIAPTAGAAERRGDQGYGLMIGNPSGFSAKMWLDEQMAIDGAVGVARSEFDIHASLLWHVFGWTKNSTVISPTMKQADDNKELPLYFGIGPRLLFEDDREFGIRFPVGITYLPNSKPWDFFFELAPVFRLSPSTGFNGDFAIGARYYFKAIRAKSSE